MHADSLSRKPNAADPSPEEQVTVDVMFMDPLQLSSHMVQNRQTGEQMTHWDMLNKATTKFEVSLFNMS